MRPEAQAIELAAVKAAAACAWGHGTLMVSYAALSVLAAWGCHAATAEGAAMDRAVLLACLMHCPAQRPAMKAAVADVDEAVVRHVHSVDLSGLQLTASGSLLG